VLVIVFAAQKSTSGLCLDGVIAGLAIFHLALACKYIAFLYKAARIFKFPRQYRQRLSLPNMLKVSLLIVLQEILHRYAALKGRVVPLDRDRGRYNIGRSSFASSVEIKSSENQSFRQTSVARYRLRPLHQIDRKYFHWKILGAQILCQWLKYKLVRGTLL
jgi:hypothetical protein